MADKKLDMIIANNPTAEVVEFGSDFNKATIFVKGKRQIDLKVMPKRELAEKILDELAIILKRVKK